MGEAGDRLRQLADHIGVGRLEGTVEVNQVYAHYQHEGLDFKHPRGGQALYLQAPLYESTDRYMQSIANDVLDVEKNLTDSVFDVTQALVREVEVRAPVEFTNLRRSGHATVTENGAVVRDQPPAQHRLSEQELKALGRLRGGHPYGMRGASLEQQARILANRARLGH